MRQSAPSLLWLSSGEYPVQASVPLPVKMVGAFEASFVPTLADFARLDARSAVQDFGRRVEGAVAEAHPESTFEHVDGLVVLGAHLRRHPEPLSAELCYGDRLARVAPILFHDDRERSEANGLALVAGERPRPFPRCRRALAGRAGAGGREEPLDTRDRHDLRRLGDRRDDLLGELRPVFLGAPQLDDVEAFRPGTSSEPSYAGWRPTGRGGSAPNASRPCERG